MTSPLTLRARNVTIRRRGSVLLQDFDWEHRVGEIAWVIGENGAGKSTLLRAFARRLRPTEGAIEHIGGAAFRVGIQYMHPGMAGPPSCRLSSWVLLQRALLPDTTALLSWSDPLCPDLPPAVGLDSLSTGERKRVLLHALLRRPGDFTILDEPYEHLSDQARQRLTEILIARAAGSVVIVATNQPIPRFAAGVTLRIDSSRT